MAKLPSGFIYRFKSKDGVTVDIAEKELVLCPDCKYHEDEEPGMVYCPEIVGGWVSNDFYCAAGERKEIEE